MMLIASILTLQLVKETVAIEYYCGNIAAEEAGGAFGHFALSIQDDGTGSVNLEVDLNGIDKSVQQSCDLSQGLSVHIHGTWENNALNSGSGGLTCGLGKTSNHYDPYLGCSPKSNNQDSGDTSKPSGLCHNANKGYPSTSKVPYVYGCNKAAFASKKEVCEVGDITGKFGILLPLNATNNLVFKLSTTIDNYPLLKDDYLSHDLTRGWASVVLHCAGGTAKGKRLVCAKMTKDLTLCSPSTYPPVVAVGTPADTSKPVNIGPYTTMRDIINQLLWGSSYNSYPSIDPSNHH